MGFIKQGFLQVQLKLQVNSSRKKGLYQLIQNCSNKNNLSFSLLLALASRETGIRNIYGDRKFGHGAFQIDSHSFPEICKHSFLTEPMLFLNTGANLLKNNIEWAEKTWPKFSPQQHLKCALAAYNCGKGNVVKAVADGNCDLYTAHSNYGVDILNRKQTIENMSLDKLK